MYRTGGRKRISLELASPNYDEAMCTSRDLFAPSISVVWTGFGHGRASSQRPAHSSVDAATATQPPAEQTARNEPDGDAIAAVPNRPTFATTALTVQPGVLEIEYGFQGDRAHQNINGLLKFGLSKSLELRFAPNPIEWIRELRAPEIAASVSSGNSWCNTRRDQTWRCFIAPPYPSYQSIGRSRNRTFSTSAG